MRDEENVLHDVGMKAFMIMLWLLACNRAIVIAIKAHAMLLDSAEVWLSRLYNEVDTVKFL